MDQPHYVEMPSQCVIFSKEAGNNPGFLQQIFYYALHSQPQVHVNHLKIHFYRQLPRDAILACASPIAKSVGTPLPHSIEF